jgi:DNA-binding FrmR family transcriptional regulator
MTDSGGAGCAPAASATETGPPYGYVDEKDALIKRMRRIEGQTRGIEKMISEDRYCIDILTQIAAVSTALEAVAGRILDDHVNHCVRHALSSGDDAVAAAKTKELLEAVHRFTRTL